LVAANSFYYALLCRVATAITAPLSVLRSLAIPHEVGQEPQGNSSDYDNAVLWSIRGEMNPELRTLLSMSGVNFWVRIQGVHVQGFTFFSLVAIACLVRLVAGLLSFARDESTRQPG
ncbi:unnamed protein product, partial [Scytosiphon promiscuus]